MRTEDSGLSPGRSVSWTNSKAPMARTAVRGVQIQLDGFSIENSPNGAELALRSADGILYFVELMEPLPDCAAGCFMRTSSSCCVCLGPV